MSASPAFDEAVRAAVSQWNAVFEHDFGISAFAWSKAAKGADIVIQFKPATGVAHAMGETELDADKCGTIMLPVWITLMPQAARGGTNASQVSFDVAAHELGHALGLPHIDKPASIMCCNRGGIDFKDPATRAAYIEARRHPDLAEVGPDLKERYVRFWAKRCP